MSNDETSRRGRGATRTLTTFAIFFATTIGSSFSLSSTTTTMRRRRIATPFAVATTTTTTTTIPRSARDSSDVVDRRAALLRSSWWCVAAAFAASSSPAANAANFTPGGTLVEYEVGPRVGNPEASPSRRLDNANVLFAQDHYLKFGAAAPWIPEGGTDFPKTVPFVLRQQRYDALGKYGARVRAGLRAFAEIDLASTSSTSVPDADAPAYAFRAMGLLANNFLASENTGTTNELLLARWYVNEAYLRVGDVRAASSPEEAAAAWEAGKKALNSYAGLLNRSITDKVGDKLALLSATPVASADANKEDE